MFTRIRWRLVAWTMVVLTLILLTLGTAVYAALARTLLDQVDRNLASRSEQAASALSGSGRQDRGRGEHEGYRGGAFYVMLGPNGQILANPQQVNLTSLPTATPATRGGAYTTTTLNGEPTRLFARPIGERGTAGLVIVGQSLGPEEAALRLLLLILVAGGGIGLLLSLGGAWFLAGRALVPIEQAFRRQQEFVADASHELRTPLTVLRSATDLLNQHRAEPIEANGELFDDVRTEIVRLERLATDMLTLARSDRGELELAVAPVDVGMLAAEVVRRIGPLARERGVRLTEDLEDQAGAAAPGSTVSESLSPLIVEADPDRLRQVLLILLDNAIKHTPAGGQVIVGVRQQGADALLEVVDTGTGIAAEHLPRNFDRFYRADLARSRAAGGTGLGLPIARTLVEAHDGSLTLASTPGEGTRATVRLRLESPPRRHGHLGELATRLTHPPAGQVPPTSLHTDQPNGEPEPGAPAIPTGPGSARPDHSGL
jgi:signal transduction histidine kinase